MSVVLLSGVRVIPTGFDENKLKAFKNLAGEKKTSVFYKYHQFRFGKRW